MTTSARKPHDAIREDFKARAIAAGRSPLEAATNAEVVARAFTWFGAQSGRDPLEVYRTEMPVSVHGPGGVATAARNRQQIPGAGRRGRP